MFYETKTMEDFGLDGNTSYGVLRMIYMPTEQNSTSTPTPAVLVRSTRR